jgi:hypothetical protein
MSESYTCISHLFLCNDEVIECYVGGLIDLCSTRDRRDAFPLTGERQASRFTLCKAARIRNWIRIAGSENG